MFAPATERKKMVFWKLNDTPKTLLILVSGVSENPLGFLRTERKKEAETNVSAMPQLHGCGITNGVP
ncbi:MAG: hypothetical protein AAB316_19815 [Bacteroidota bacterium]